MAQLVSLRIDGELVQAQAGQSILSAALAKGKYIPSLCAFPGLKTVGACRLCLVEIAGGGRLIPACTTPVAEGMAVTTKSARLTKYRQMALELLFAERNHVCAVCVSNNHCELQDLAVKLGVTNVRFAYRFPRLEVDMTHSRFVLDHNRCVLCSRCVRVCSEVEGAHVWDIASRGISSRVVCEMNQRWGESRSCTNCGKCVQVCPTGALVEKGAAAEEMIKRNEPIRRLAGARGGAH
jgi:bidirectional [NiFe] hydrogenase diaphorase subunit